MGYAARANKSAEKAAQRGHEKAKDLSYAELLDRQTLAEPIGQAVLSHVFGKRKQVIVTAAAETV